MSGNEILGDAEQAKQQNKMGNSFVRRRRWDLAIEAYSKAITLDPQIPSYWMNRALCYYKRKNWVLVEEDCRRAIHLGSAIIKTHHMLGVALQRRRKYAEGIRELEKALDLARSIYPNFDIVRRIQRDLARGKYSKWAVAARKQSRRLRTLREACLPALKLNESQLEGFMDEVEAASSPLEALEDVFRKATEADRPTEVPDYLCCAITLGILQDPVVTPYGHTYDKEAIIRHLEQNNFDPITRRPLDQSQLAPNLAVKKAVQAFLDKHGWAYKELIGDDDLQAWKLSAKYRKME